MKKTKYTEKCIKFSFMLKLGGFLGRRFLKHKKYKNMYLLQEYVFCRYESGI